MLLVASLFSQARSHMRKSPPCGRSNPNSAAVSALFRQHQKRLAALLWLDAVAGEGETTERVACGERIPFDRRIQQAFGILGGNRPAIRRERVYQFDSTRWPSPPHFDSCGSIGRLRSIIDKPRQAKVEADSGAAASVERLAGIVHLGHLSHPGMVPPRRGCDSSGV